MRIAPRCAASCNRPCPKGPMLYTRSSLMVSTCQAWRRPRASASGRPAFPACYGSPRGTTGANWDLFICTCTNCSVDKRPAMLTLTYKGTTTVPVEAECLTPDHLVGKSPGEIAALPVQHGNAQAPLGEFFSIDGDSSDGELTIEGDCTRVKW